MSISVVYWSGTGNTQAMAEAIGEGIESAGAQANVISVDQASVDAEQYRVNSKNCGMNNKVHAVVLCWGYALRLH